MGVEFVSLPSITVDLTCEIVGDVEIRGCGLSWTFTTVISWLFVITSYICCVWSEVVYLLY